MTIRQKLLILGSLADRFIRMTKKIRRSRNQSHLSNRELEAESVLRRKSEDALSRSEQNFRTLFEYATDALFILDREGNFIDVNRIAYERLGYTKEEMLSLHISQLDPPEYAAQVPKRLELLKKQGWAVFESAHLRKDGTVMPVEINARLLDYDNRKVFFSVIRDITERKQAEDALGNTNARLRALIQTIPDMVMFKDTAGRHLIVNRKVEEVTGHSQAEIVGKSVEELMPPGPAEACRKSDEEAMKRRAPVHAEERLVDKEGAVRYFDMVKAAMVDDRDALAGLVVIGRDITERKQAEEELRKHRESLVSIVEERTRELSQANEKLRKEIAGRERMEAELLKAQKLESVGILAGGIAHDFNNLLTTVLGNISIALLDLDQGHPAYQGLARAERATLRAQDLTQQFLTFSKGGAPVKKTTSIGDLIRESAGFALRGAKVKCDFDVPDTLWLVDIDEGQMSQVIHNLIINADQAMPNGGTISVRCENVTLPVPEGPPLSGGLYVKIVIQDQGIGIPQKDLVKIFDPYFTTKQRGTGLGLATSYAIIQKHGGCIFAESELNAGATFTIYLPATGRAGAVRRDENARLPATEGKILIMDDDEDVRETAGSSLRRLGYSVAFAEDGSRAIELYEEARKAGNPYDAVIMDLTISGGMGGRETIRRISEIDPAVKAIVSSGYSNDPVMADYPDYGFAGVVAKPYRIKELAEVVHRVIAKRREVPGDHTTM